MIRSHAVIWILPEDWVANLPGQVIVAAHAALLASEERSFDPIAIDNRWFNGNVPVGAAISGGAATALTDFRIHADGFARHLLLDRSTTPWQAGRGSRNDCSRSILTASWRCWRCRSRAPRRRSDGVQNVSWST